MAVFFGHPFLVVRHAWRTGIIFKARYLHDNTVCIWGISVKEVRLTLRGLRAFFEESAEVIVGIN